MPTLRAYHIHNYIREGNYDNPCLPQWPCTSVPSNLSAVPRLIEHASSVAAVTTRATPHKSNENVVQAMRPVKEIEPLRGAKGEDYICDYPCAHRPGEAEPMVYGRLLSKCLSMHDPSALLGIHARRAVLRRLTHLRASWGSGGRIGTTCRRARGSQVLRGSVCRRADPPKKHW